MSYMWKDFNIKTFAAETIVYRDGAYCAELSTLENSDINKKYDLPVHLIYFGEIAGKNDLIINISAQNQPVFLSIDIKNKLPAFLNIFIKNTGKNSELRGQVMLNNLSELKYNCAATHGADDTGILVYTKLLAQRDSNSELYGNAIIEKNCKNAISDISFKTMMDKNAKVKFMPAQNISTIPTSADHSASVYQQNDAQQLFLRQGGLSSDEIKHVATETFINDFPLF